MTNLAAHLNHDMRLPGGSATGKKTMISGIGFEFYRYFFPPVKVSVPGAWENHFREGTEKVLGLPGCEGIRQDKKENPASMIRA